MKNAIKIYCVDEELRAFSLTANGRSDEWNHTVIIMHTCVQYLKSTKQFCILCLLYKRNCWSEPSGSVVECLSRD